MARHHASKKHHKMHHDGHHSSHHGHHSSHHSSHHSAHRSHMISGGHYDGAEPRRRQEMEDAGMIHEDHSQIANLPQEVKMHMYPRTGPWTPENIDDTIFGVDRQMDGDDSQKMRHFHPKKL